MDALNPGDRVIYTPGAGHAGQGDIGVVQRKHDNTIGFPDSYYVKWSDGDVLHARIGDLTLMSVTEIGEHELNTFLTAAIQVVEAAGYTVTKKD